MEACFTKPARIATPWLKITVQHGPNGPAAAIRGLTPLVKHAGRGLRQATQLVSD
jgi:hypothetical protein